MLVSRGMVAMATAVVLWTGAAIFCVAVAVARKKARGLMMTMTATVAALDAGVGGSSVASAAIDRKRIAYACPQDRFRRHHHHVTSFLPRRRRHHKRIFRARP